MNVQMRRDYEGQASRDMKELSARISVGIPLDGTVMPANCAQQDPYLRKCREASSRIISLAPFLIEKIFGEP